MVGPDTDVMPFGPKTEPFVNTVAQPRLVVPIPITPTLRPMSASVATGKMAVAHMPNCGLSPLSRTSSSKDAS